MAASSANLRLLGEAHHKLKAEPEAEAALDHAVAINRALVARQTDDRRNIRKLPLSLWYREVVLRTNKKDELARVSIDEAVTKARILLARDANDVGALKLFGAVAEVKVQLLADMTPFPASFAMSDEVISTYRRLFLLAGNTTGESRSLATALTTRGGIIYNRAAYQQACAAWRGALGVFSALEVRNKLTETDRLRADDAKGHHRIHAFCAKRLTRSRDLGQKRIASPARPPNPLTLPANSLVPSMKPRIPPGLEMFTPTAASPRVF